MAISSDSRMTAIAHVSVDCFADYLIFDSFEIEERRVKPGNESSKRFAILEPVLRARGHHSSEHTHTHTHTPNRSCHAEME